MKIIAFNGSPRGKKGNTFIILTEMNKGIQRAGASMDIINLIDQNIHMCIGCLNCWKKSNPKEVCCVLDDDMHSLVSKMMQADLIIFASPLYYDHITALLKLFIERLVQMHTAYVVKRNEWYVHDIEIKLPSIVFLCSCDLPGLSNFDLVGQYMKRVAWNLQCELIEEIYQCEGRLIQWQSDGVKVAVNSQRRVWEKAGFELAMEKKISDQTKRFFRTPIIPYKYYIETANEIADEMTLSENEGED